MVRPELASRAYIQRIMGHHTTAREAGLVFARTRPKLAAFTHLALLGGDQVAPPTLDDLLAATRQTYDGPLEVGEDLMSFDIAETVTVSRVLQQNRRDQQDIFAVSNASAFPVIW